MIIIKVMTESETERQNDETRFFERRKSWIERRKKRITITLTYFDETLFLPAKRLVWRWKDGN